MEFPQNWPEPIVPVQSLVDNGVSVIPRRYVKPPSERQKLDSSSTTPNINIPIVDMKGLGDAAVACPETIHLISDACKEWGFLQVLNHGVSLDLMKRMREVWREFFHLPLGQKQRYANSPMILDGYGSRNLLTKNAPLDWGDYFYLGILPQSRRILDRWPVLPISCRETIEEYTMEVKKLSINLMKVMSVGLGLDMEYLEKAMGGEDAQTNMRVNYYPRCPQPELTLGIRVHTDSAGLTILLADDHVKGLRFRKGETWITTHPITNALLVNIGDTIQVLSNGIYKSPEHTAVVNIEEARLSVAFFFHAKNDIPIVPAKELVTPDFKPLYRPITYDEYKIYRLRKPMDKAHTETFLKTK